MAREGLRYELMNASKRRCVKRDRYAQECIAGRRRKHVGTSPSNLSKAKRLARNGDDRLCDEVRPDKVTGKPWTQRVANWAGLQHPSGSGEHAQMRPRRRLKSRNCSPPTKAFWMLEIMNEELHTVNQELRNRLMNSAHEQRRKNLFNSTDIATFFWITVCACGASRARRARSLS
jgi:hypothetical protein